MPKPPLNLAGLPVHPVDVKELHAFIAQAVAKREKSIILHLNAHGASLAWRLPWLKDFFRQAQLVFCDGDGVRWGLKLLGENPPPKITYDRWIWQLAEFCAERGFKLFLLGSRPGIAAEASFRLKKKFPALQIAGTHHGYFKREGGENEEIVRYINSSRPDIIIVGFGMPAQEKWLSENRQKLDASVFLTGGAVFDYASGSYKRAPQWMIRNQMEWLFRFLQEPKRLFARYVFGLPYFFYKILMYKWFNGGAGK